MARVLPFWAVGRDGIVFADEYYGDIPWAMQQLLTKLRPAEPPLRASVGTDPQDSVTPHRNRHNRLSDYGSGNSGNQAW